jgi:hypothetical protein
MTTEQEPASFECELPIPPSVNALYFNVAGKGRVKTPEYAAWQKEAGYLLLAAFSRAGKPHIGPRFGMLVKIHNNLGCDISNRIKATEDLFVYLKITPDDRKCDAIQAVRTVGVAVDSSTIAVKIWSIK